MESDKKKVTPFKKAMGNKMANKRVRKYLLLVSYTLLCNHNILYRYPCIAICIVSWEKIMHHCSHNHCIVMSRYLPSY